MPLPYNGKNKPIARYLRKNPTKQENHLWYDFLRNYPVRFHRQMMIDNYIADFYCHEARLVIEVDGRQHRTDEGLARDEIRTFRLEKYGLTVIRVSNRAVDQSFMEVCRYIDHVVQDRIK